MINQEEKCQLLTKLGLTSSQAKIYLTLTNLGPATAKTISTAAQIDRADTYRVIATLQKQSLVEKIIAHPLKFRAAPIQEGITILLERKHKENAEIHRTTMLLLKQNRDKETEKKAQEETTQFTLIPPKEKHICTFIKVLDKTQTSLDIIILAHYAVPPLKYIEPVKKFLKQGGKFRVITCGVKKTGKLQKEIKEFYNSAFAIKGFCEVRHTPRRLLVWLAIFDKKELLITSQNKIRPEESPNLLTNSPIIVRLAVEYFERIWNALNST